MQKTYYNSKIGCKSQTCTGPSREMIPSNMRHEKTTPKILRALKLYMETPTKFRTNPASLIQYVEGNRD